MEIINLSSYLFLSKIVEITIYAHGTNVAYFCLSGISDVGVSGMFQLFKSLKVSASVIHICSNI